MDAPGVKCIWPFGTALKRWRAVGGGIDSDGNIVTKPVELTYAETIIGLCDRFHCLPSQLENESAELLRMLRIIELGGKGGPNG